MAEATGFRMDFPSPHPHLVNFFSLLSELSQIDPFSVTSLVSYRTSRPHPHHYSSFFVATGIFVKYTHSLIPPVTSVWAKGGALPSPTLTIPLPLSSHTLFLSTCVTHLPSGWLLGTLPGPGHSKPVCILNGLLPPAWDPWRQGWCWWWLSSLSCLPAWYTLHIVPLITCHLVSARLWDLCI